jgi:transposase
MAFMTAVGIDVAKATFDAAFFDGKGKVHHKQFANRSKGFAEFSTWLRKHEIDQAHVCMEATGAYSYALTCWLHERDYTVSLVNPARIHAYAKSRLSRNKTDKADAALIAHFCQSQQPPTWKPPLQHQHELQVLVRHLESLLDLKQQQLNRLEIQPAASSVRESIATLITCFDQQIKQIKLHIEQHINRHEVLANQQKLLTSIPGIGKLMAAKLLGEIDHLTDYDNARQVASYAGLTPRQQQSGSSVRGKTRLSKTGNSRVRKALYLPAIAAIRYNPLIRALAQRLRERQKCPMAIVGAAMRKLLHLAFGVLKTGLPFDAEHALST